MSAIKDTVQNFLGSLGGHHSAVTEPSTDQLNQLKEKYEKAGQGQVFAFYDGLSTAEKAALYGQLAGFDPAHINELFQKVTNPSKTTSDGAAPTLEPLPDSATCSVLDSNEQDLKRWYESGLDLVADNKVAVVLMAGGQGTRLGSSAPKGCYDIGLPSKKSLFHLQAERILKVQQLAGKKRGNANAVVPWYVMTSGPTRGPTQKYFEENNYFGLKKENVIIFEQGVLPCISNDGKILLESKSKVRGSLGRNIYTAVNPNQISRLP
jgi:UDP-N-acetylglucosamine/UDP-N-acetylgalactosamine diphosphorylase